MSDAKYKSPSHAADRFILRFHEDGLRDALKQRAAQNKRSLNAEILYLIEKGVQATDATIPDS